MEVQGKQVATRGVPSGYGYIRKYFKSKNMTKYWPVKLIKYGMGYRYEYLFNDEGNPINRFSREDCIKAIMEVTTEVTTNASK